MYVKSLGAEKVFDYKEEGVMDKMVQELKDEGIKLELIYDAVGASKECNEIAKALNPGSRTKMVSAVALGEGSGQFDALEASFILPPTDELERKKWMHFVLGQWLSKVLEDKKYKPSPKPKLFKSVAPTSGGLKSIEEALDELKKGVSGIKLIVEV